MPVAPTRPTVPPPAGSWVVPADRPGLRALWTRERDLAARPGARHDGGPGRECRGRHGRLLDDGLDLLLEPALRGGGTPGYSSFAALDERIAAGLLERLTDDELAGRQNLGPSLGAVLRAVVRHPDRVRAHGYVIGPLRCDERITVTGALVRSDHPLPMDERHRPALDRAAVERLLGGLGIDDMHAPPDEVTPLDDAAPGVPAHWYRAWWD